MTKGKTPRKRWPPSKTELDALIEEAIVDAYGESEQRTGFYTMLEEHLAMPFEVEIRRHRHCRTHRPDRRRRIVAVCSRGNRGACPDSRPAAAPPPEGAD